MLEQAVDPFHGDHEPTSDCSSSALSITSTFHLERLAKIAQ
jgi:hypothetical protein